MFRKIWWWMTRREYWASHIDGKWCEFRTGKEAFKAACDQVIRTGVRADVLYVWWWDDDYGKPRWANQTQYEGQEIFEFATGRRSLPDDKTLS